MDQKRLRNLLADLQAGRVDLPTAVAQLEKLPFEDIGYAKIDHHRCCRTGVSEVIFCEGKTRAQIQGIVTRLAAGHDNILATRAAPEVYAAVREVAPDCSYHEAARIVVVKPRPLAPIGNIAVLCAGTSDIPVAEEAAVTAEVLGSRVVRIYDVGVAGIHRLLDKREQLGRANVAVVVAGMEGALTSVVGGLVPYPVIGVPTSIGYGASFGGLAALLAMLNSCAAGVSVVNIDNGFGAGYQAALINRLAVCGVRDNDQGMNCEE
ncbi:MAG: nickel pincer cofactor biosynthesis protein LarB [Desulfobacteraceae bacterium]|jgi:NCAIR mutase (PurE)-related protein